MSRDSVSTVDSRLPDASSVALPIRCLLGVTGWIGEAICHRISWMTLLASSVLMIARLSLLPSTWRRTVRDETIRQSYYTCIQAIWIVAVIAILVGFGFVAQLLYWTSLAGQNEYVGPFLSIVLVREVAPLLVALIVLGRSGTAIVAEIGAMRVTGAVDLIESAGVDPVLYLIVPRAVATAASIAALTVWMILVALVAGYWGALGLDLTNLTAGQFVNEVLGALDLRAYLVVLVKTLLSGWVIGIMCTTHGLGCNRSISEVPQLLPRCFIECLLAAFIISGAVSVIL